MVIIDKNSNGYEEISVTDRLIELITQMTDEEQEKLLKVLEKSQPKRREQRQAAFIDITFSVEGKEYKGVTYDISLGGLFVETNGVFSVGQEILMNIPFSKSKKLVEKKGEIVRVKPEGIGVKFMR